MADADIDKMMKRTARRPLARATVPTQPRAGVRAGAVGRLVLLAVVDDQPAVGACWRWATIAFYVFVYTLLLKRRTSQNVVWGGAAGCMPVMIGWSAVTGTIAWPALVMFAIIFFWTPPHTWALAMRYKDDYKAAGRADAAGRGHRAAGHQADPDLHLADGAGDAGAGPGDGLAVRRGGRCWPGPGSW